MRCFICDAAIDNPKYNRDHEQWEPCGTCLEVISDTLGAFKDQVVWVEEDLPEARSSQNHPLM